MTMELERTAYHEAGHAVAYRVLGLGVKWVTIERDLLSKTAGRVMPLIGFETGEVAENHAVACLAGAIAVREWDPERLDWRYGAEDDFRRADEQIDAAVGGDTKDISSYALRRASISMRVREQAERLVNDHWSEIQALASALLVERTIQGDQLARIIRRSRLNNPIRARYDEQARVAVIAKPNGERFTVTGITLDQLNKFLDHYERKYGAHGSDGGELDYRAIAEVINALN